MMGKNLADLLRAATLQLTNLPQATPRLEAELLLMEATGLSREQLFAWPDRFPDPAHLRSFEKLLARRLTGEPIAHIRGHQAFWTLDLRVTPDTLIPRPETEMLVEIALELLPAPEPLTILDAGTGSGAIAAALAVERPAWTLIGIERSTGAATVAAQNMRRCGAANARIVRADWLAPIAAGSLHAVVGNPPYVRAGDPHLGRGDLPREPALALTSGEDGLEAIRQIAEQAAVCLKPQGLLAVEHGFDQGKEVRTILAREGFERIDTGEDLAGHPRVSLGFAPPRHEGRDMKDSSAPGKR
jgi:release factor glutamine methyltransferase